MPAHVQLPAMQAIFFQISVIFSLVAISHVLMPLATNSILLQETAARRQWQEGLYWKLLKKFSRIQFFFNPWNEKKWIDCNPGQIIQVCWLVIHLRKARKGYEISQILSTWSAETFKYFTIAKDCTVVALYSAFFFNVRIVLVKFIRLTIYWRNHFCSFGIC